MANRIVRRLSVQSLGGQGRVLQAVARGKPAVFKMVDPDAGWVQQLQRTSPETTLVGRVTDDSLSGKLSAPEGRHFAERVLLKARELGGAIRWWEGSNEAAKGRDATRRLCEFEQAFAERLQSEGFHALVGGFSTGVPEIVGPGNVVPWMGEWELLYPAMSVAHGVHFHEYWNPFQLQDDWNALRFLKWWPALPEWARSKWWLVSELGVDGGLAFEGRKGWQGYMPAATYLDLLRKYAQAMEPYPKLAATIYMAGTGADPSWATYDVAGEMLDLISQDWMAAPALSWGTEVPQRPEDGGEVISPGTPETRGTDAIWQTAFSLAWQSVKVAHIPDFDLPKKAKQVLGPHAFALSDEKYFEVGTASFVHQLWSDGAVVKMLVAEKPHFELDQIRVDPATGGETPEKTGEPPPQIKESIAFGVNDTNHPRTDAGALGHTVAAARGVPCQPGQIKGNRASKIYHLPGMRSYASTAVNVQCFDTEEQAKAAGYRKAQQ
ncbi:MAG: hypothetical protein EXR62_07555 [Chloroflexi bacterium]|nr:hypothetical protein [Chloroflexota bacterium]